MHKKWCRAFLVFVLVLAALAACGGGTSSVSPSDEPLDESVGSAGATSEGLGPATEAADARASEGVASATGVPATKAAAVATSGGTAVTGGASATAGTLPTSTRTPTVVLAAAYPDHENAADYAWVEAQVIAITLDGSTATTDAAGVVVDGSRVTITAAGTYRLSGSLDDGRIVVDTQDDGTVRLILDGADIHNETGAAIHVANADKTVIVLADGTESRVSDGASYELDDPETDEPNAALFSEDALTIWGAGSLVVEGTYNDGIASKDGLILAGGAIQVTAVDDGIRGKDYLVVKGGQITVAAGGDGLKSDNDQDETAGLITVEGGVLDITAGGDAIQAHTAVWIAGGEFTVTTGGGSSARLDASTSAKGIKAGDQVVIDTGTFHMNTADDAIHSNGSLVIHGGTFVIATGDDAIHADGSIEIYGGSITITDSYEGLESAVITVNAGEIWIVSSDDGINLAGGTDGSGTQLQAGFAGGRPGRGGGPGMDNFADAANYQLYINGGTIVVDSGGDGVDSNGSIEMTGGVVLIHGPTENMNGALDYVTTFQISGGLLVAVGSAGMAEAPDASSSQCSLLLNLNGTLRAGNLIHIESAGGDEVLTFAPSKNIQSIAFSSPDLEPGETYDVYYGGSSTGEESGGLYQGGTYSAGTEYVSFTTNSVVTMLGTGGRW